MEDDFDAKTVIAYTRRNMKEYVLRMSKYISCKSEWLDEAVHRVLVPTTIKMLFLFKKGVNGVGKGIDSMKDRYVTSGNTYYNEWWKHTEAKYRVNRLEVCMGFYLDILQSFCVTGENVIGIYLGAKFMLAAKVRQEVLLIVIFASKITVVGFSYHQC